MLVIDLRVLSILLLKTMDGGERYLRCGIEYKRYSGPRPVTIQSCTQISLCCLKPRFYQPYVGGYRLVSIMSHRSSDRNTHPAFR